MLSREFDEVEMRQQLERDAFLPIESIDGNADRVCRLGCHVPPHLLLFLNLTQMLILLKEMQFKLSKNNLNVETRKIKTTEK